MFICGLFLAGGMMVSLWNLYHIAINPIKPEVVGSSLYYGEGTYFQRFAYGFVVFTPLLISSFKGMRVLGLLGIVSFAIANYVFDANFTSVWCFFAAVIGVYIYKILADNNQT